MQPGMDPIPEPAALMHDLDALLGEAAEIGDMALVRLAVGTYRLDQRHGPNAHRYCPTGADVAVCASG